MITRKEAMERIFDRSPETLRATLVFWAGRYHEFMIGKALSDLIDAEIVADLQTKKQPDEHEETDEHEVGPCA